MLLRLLVLLAIAAAAPAEVRAEIAPIPFSSAEFERAQAAGKPILVYVGASWCVTCSLQQAAIADALSQVESRHELPGMVVLAVDFDTQKDAVGVLKVPVESTLILFHGKREIGRSTGETDAAAIASFIKRGSSGGTAPEELLSGFGYALALLAGMLSILAPCVLPLLPIVFATTVTDYHWGPVALAAGIGLSYAITGLVVAAIGFGIGSNATLLRDIGAAFMAGFGLILLSDRIREALPEPNMGLANAANRLLARLKPRGVGGHFIIGALLGVVWGPCVGPTLAAAVTMASARKALWQVALTMLLYGVGAAIPLAILGTLGHVMLMRVRQRGGDARSTVASWAAELTTARHVGDVVLGIALLIIAAGIFTGADRAVETTLLRVWPEWLAKLAVSI